MKEPDTNANYEPDELEETNADQDTGQESSSFYDIKEKASMNLSQLLEDLQAFEKAVREEDIPEIYRLYNGRLNEELKRSSNENHEIDQLLMRKIHDRFLQEFPFMEQVENISPTMSYYKIGTYYHDRPTVGIDASLPEIFVLPKIDEEWEKYSQPESTDYDKKINELDAKVITAQTEIERLDEQIKEINRQMTDLNDNKGFLNRKKIEEEIQELEKKKQVLSNEKLGWLPYIETPETIQQQKEALKQEARADQLRAAIVEKEQRQIRRYFGNKEGFGQAIHEFLMNYLGNENPNNQSNEGGSEYE
ncbi:TPA: viral A-type inclusion protein [Enterococcus faecium]|uniref:coiled-coil domain-containing protein n=1 Tax=Enterococcus faecium TaxID=1352 RepID=UPI001C372075|nr:viral A-type inclusion protein [Enterococcus faecium]MCF8613578.1 viral A-type inclusion protein [Enterococcus faecium]MCF8651557.1 viral A-type inclusion protein [Enterococcus faecium]MCF8666052.1 viral A-type inclusion protein [Enterococcus faecium]MCF8686655.1 viral A-type inclusion protein [Enterococcus faecium]HBH6339546.1 viral A-type inclusion protein [Enterococcus faecium]